MVASSRSEPQGRGLCGVDRPDYRISIDVIWHGTLAALEALDASADRDLPSAIAYRDRLMLALLAFTLLRRKNLAQLELRASRGRKAAGPHGRGIGHQKPPRDRPAASRPPLAATSMLPCTGQADAPGWPAIGESLDQLRRRSTSG